MCKSPNPIKMPLGTEALVWLVWLRFDYGILWWKCHSNFEIGGLPVTSIECWGSQSENREPHALKKNHAYKKYFDYGNDYGIPLQTIITTVLSYFSFMGVYIITNICIYIYMCIYMSFVIYVCVAVFIWFVPSERTSGQLPNPSETLCFKHKSLPERPSVAVSIVFYHVSGMFCVFQCWCRACFPHVFTVFPLGFFAHTCPF